MRDILMLAVFAAILLLIWGYYTKNVVPKNQISTPASPATTLSANCGSSAGDTFNTGKTIAAGVTEPAPPPMQTIAAPSIPTHVFYPVDPTPIAIQKSPVRVSTASAPHCDVGVIPARGLLGKVISPSSPVKPRTSNPIARRVVLA
jgi:hypothetical protein